MKLATRTRYQRVKNLTLAAVLAVSSLVATVQVALSTQVSAVPGAVYSTVSLNGWTTDRTYPSGGTAVESYMGRMALRLAVDNENASASTGFYRTEGVKTAIANSDSVKADLYVESDWDDKDIRAGLWVVGRDTSGAITSYPIVEYTQSTSFEGWRIWDSASPAGWVNYPAVGYNVDGWNALELSKNSADDTITDVYINGALVGTSTGDPTDYFTEIILNSYNYAQTADKNYTASWSNVEVGSYRPDMVENVRITRDADGTVMADETVVSDTDYTLRWDRVDNTERYQIRVTDPNGDTQAKRYTGTPRFALDDATRHGHFGTIEGQWSYEIRNKDATTGLWSEWTDPIGLGYDTTRPEVELLNGQPVVNGTSTIFQVKATDNVELHRVVGNLYQGGTLIKSTQSGVVNDIDEYTHNVNLGSLAEGTYSLRYNALDKAGHLSQTKNFSFRVDNTAPAAVFQKAPADPASGVQHIRPRVNGELDGSMIDKYIYLDNVEIGHVNSAHRNYDFNLDTTLYSDGVHTLKFVAIDEAGNESEVSLDFVIDNQGPTITVKDSSVGSDDIYSNVSFKLFDENQVDKYVINGTVRDFTNNNWSDANFANIKSKLIDGGLNTIVLYDVAGNSTSYEFTYDSIAPTIQIDNAVVAASYSENDEMRVRVNDDVAYDKTVIKKYDAAGTSLTAWEKVYTGKSFHVRWLSDGKYQFTVYDKAGNTTVVEFEMDRTDPVVTIATPADNETVAGAADIVVTGTASDEGGINRVVLFITDTNGDRVQRYVQRTLTGDDWTITVPAGDLADGEYRFNVNVYDEFRNVTTVRHTVFVETPASDSDGDVAGATDDASGDGGTTTTTTGTDTTEENSSESETNSLITPLTNSPSALFATSAPFTSATTGENAGDNVGSDGDVEGTSVEGVAQVDTDATDGSFWGVAWYWWLLILAALSALVAGIFAASRRNNA